MSAADDLGTPAFVSPIACPDAPGNEVLLGVVMDLADWTASCARSAAEAAWRGDEATVGVHLHDALSALTAALKVYREITCASEERT